MTTFYTHSHLILQWQIHEDDIRFISITNELTAHIYTTKKKKKHGYKKCLSESLTDDMHVPIVHPHAWYWYAKNHSKATMSVLRTMIFNSRNCKYMWELGRLRFLNLTSSSWQCRCRGPTCVITIVHSHNQTGSPWTCSFPAHPIHKQNETKISELNRIVWSWKLIQEQSPQSARLHALEPANKLKFI